MIQTNTTQAVFCAAVNRFQRTTRIEATTLSSRMIKRAPNQIADLTPLTPNGEVEGPHASGQLAPRAHTVFQRPRCSTTYASRPFERLLGAPTAEGFMTTAAAEGVDDSWCQIPAQADHMPLCCLRIGRTC